MKKLVLMLFAVAMAVIMTGCGQVDTGEAGLELTWGKVVSKPLEPGLHFRMPIAGSFVYYDIRDLRSDVTMSTYTKDMQTSDIKVSVIYAIDVSRLEEVHTKFGKNYAKILVDPAITKCVKDVIGNWEADKLVNGREKAAAEILTKVNDILKNAPINIRDVILSNIDFSDVFEKSIEAKVVAQQKAIEAKNKTVQVEEEARQKVIAAEAEAKSMKIRAEALKANQSLVALEFINKWNGIAPHTLMIGNDFKTMLPLDMK